jgi:rhodanese-related sulfurtransferase
METTTTSPKAIALREAMLIVLASILLGFAYTFVMKKGFFSPPPPIAETKAEVAPVFISYEEAKAMFDANSALFVDARHEFDYKLGHIPKAINVPLKDFELSKSPLANTAKDKVIVTYCDGAECNSSIELAKKLSAAGFTNVKMFFGGWNEWQSHHLQTETKP